jgi:hypothetical protein
VGSEMCIRDSLKELSKWIELRKKIAEKKPDEGE